MKRRINRSLIIALSISFWLLFIISIPLASWLKSRALDDELIENLDYVTVAFRELSRNNRVVDMIVTIPMGETDLGGVAVCSNFIKKYKAVRAIYLMDNEYKTLLLSLAKEEELKKFTPDASILQRDWKAVGLFNYIVVNVKILDMFGNPAAGLTVLVNPFKLISENLVTQFRLSPIVPRKYTRQLPWPRESWISLGFFRLTIINRVPYGFVRLPMYLENHILAGNALALYFIWLILCYPLCVVIYRYSLKRLFDGVIHNHPAFARKYRRLPTQGNLKEQVDRMQKTMNKITKTMEVSDEFRPKD